MESSLEVDESFEPNYGLKLGVKGKVCSTLENPVGPRRSAPAFFFSLFLQNNLMPTRLFPMRILSIIIFAARRYPSSTINGFSKLRTESTVALFDSFPGYFWQPTTGG